MLDHAPAIKAYESLIRAAEKARINTESLERYSKRMADRDRILAEQSRKEKEEREAKLNSLEQKARLVKESSRA